MINKNYLKLAINKIKNQFFDKGKSANQLDQIEHLLELFRNEYKFAPRNVFMVNNNIGITKIETGQKIYIDRNDVSLAPHLVLDGRWEPAVASWLLKNYNPATVFLDIGANFGYFSILLGSVVDSDAGGKVYAFEPNPHMVELLTKSVNINGFGNRITVVPEAVGDKSEALPLYESTEGLFGSTTLLESPTSKNLRNDKVINVDTLDAIIERLDIKNVSLIKMDIEGFEEKAFKGMQRIFSENKSLKMIMEFSPLLYQKPLLFFTKILENFNYIAVLNDEGQEISIDKYEQVIQYSTGGHCDLVLYNKK